MTKAKEFRDQSTEELSALLDDKRKELYEIVSKWKRSTKLEQPHLIKGTKKDIARLLTVLNERKIKAGA